MTSAAWGYLEDTRSWVLGVWTPAGKLAEVVDAAAAVPASSLQAVAPRARHTVAEAMLRQHGVMPAAAVFDGRPGQETTMTCPSCWSVSFDPERVRARSCGSCDAGSGSAAA
jgi:hypothetical protein